MPKFRSYQEAVEYKIEQDIEDYYNEEETIEEDEMDEADRYYDEMQDEEAIRNLGGK